MFRWIDGSGVRDGLGSKKNSPNRQRSYRPLLERLEERVNPTTAINDAYSVLQSGSLLGLNLLANDSYAGTPTINIVMPPTMGSLTQDKAGQWNYTAGPVTGKDTFTYKLWDGVAYSNTASVSIDILPAAPPPPGGGLPPPPAPLPPPLAKDDFFMVQHGHTLTGMNLLGNDMYTGTPTVTILTQPANGTLTLDKATNAWSFAANDVVAPDLFTYRITDANGVSNTANVTVNILNLATTAKDDLASVNQGQSVVLDLLANDMNPDLDTQSITIVTSPSGGTLSQSGGVLTFTASTTAVGPTTFTYKVWDGAQYSNTANVTVNVKTPPTLTLASATVSGNQVTITGSVADDAPGGLPVHFSGVTTGMAVTAPNGTFTFTGVATGVGTISAFTVDLDGNPSNTATTSISNNVPTITMSVTNIYRNQVTVSGQVTDEAPGGLTVTISGWMLGTVVAAADGSFTYTGTATGVGTLLAQVFDPLNQQGYVNATISNNVPSIIGFTATDLGNNTWQFTGSVQDEQAAGLVIFFGGLPSLVAQQVVVASDGTFSLVIQLAAGEGGFATCWTTDWLAQQSSLASAIV